MLNKGSVAGENPLRKEEVNRMFSKIHKNYDLMNHLMSLNLDKQWRHEAALEALLHSRRYRVLDVATGTGDLAIEVGRIASENGKEVSIMGSDFNKEMLGLAREKILKAGAGNISLELSDALRMPSSSGSFDVVTSAFALRSFEFGGKRSRLDLFLSESYRVLRKKGKLVLLEMALPDRKTERALFTAYTTVMRIISSFADRAAYSWLIETIRGFDKNGLSRSLRAAGFRKIRIRSLSSGVAFIATAYK